MPTPSGAFQLFTLFGIRVFLHWTWFIVAYFVLLTGRFSDDGLVNFMILIGLFGIVLMHEFGHALACRQTGGQANTIMLWPLGGVAYVSPPPRPGAVLWSVAAGPLVNVVLLPILWGAVILFSNASLTESGQVVLPTSLDEFLFSMALINTGLLIFNLLPIYPLDGGQILQSILWFFVGRAKSLFIAASVGLLGAGLFGLWALLNFDFWLLLIAIFAGMQAGRGLIVAKFMQAQEQWQRMQESGQWDPWRMMQNPGSQGPSQKPFGGAWQNPNDPNTRPNDSHDGPIIDVDAHSHPADHGDDERRR